MAFSKRVGSILFWRYHRLRASWPVWYYLLNRASRARWRVIRPVLGERERKIASALERDGIAVTSVADFFPQGFFAELAGEAEARLRRVAGRADAGRRG